MERGVGRDTGTEVPEPQEKRVGVVDGSGEWEWLMGVAGGGEVLRSVTGVR